jgi:membrane associated rhomboid family serine protease
MIASYLQGARQRFTEFGGFTVYDPSALPETASAWADCLLVRAEPGLITLVAPVPVGPEGAVRRTGEELAGLAERLAAESKAEALLVLLILSDVPLTKEQYDRWQDLRMAHRTVRLVPWVVDLPRHRLFEHTGPPFGIDPDLAILAAPEEDETNVPEPPRAHVAAEPPKPFWRMAPVTVGLIALMVLIWVAMTAAGRSLQATEEIDLLTRWGAQARPEIWLEGEYWRLFTANFLHIGLVHLAMNMFSLWVVGRVVELIYGSGRMLVIYLLSGVLAAAASAVLGPPVALSAGASGAILGLVGALLWFRFSSPLGERISLRQLLIVLGINLAVDLAAWKLIDNYNHLGGLVGGILAAMAVGVPAIDGLPWPKFRFGRWGHVALATVLLVACTALSAGAFELPGPGRDLARASDALDAGRWAEAESGFRKAVERQGDEPMPRLGLAWALYKQGRCQEAQAELTRAAAVAGDLASVSDMVTAINQCKQH